MLYFNYSKGGIKMKLKKEVKQTLILIVVSSITIILMSTLYKTTQETYEECLIKNNNDINFCHKLVE